MPSSAGKGWGRHWGAVKLLYYHCNTTKINGLWCRGVVPGRGGADIGEPLNYSTTIAIPQTVCGAEECRGVPRSVEECRVVPGRGGADIGEPLNYSTTIAIPLK